RGSTNFRFRPYFTLLLPPLIYALVIGTIRSSCEAQKASGMLRKILFDALYFPAPDVLCF
ncbi:MAG TPA: hypothetical protein VF654_07700, partial [Pyrinomonadaceae bacterium]